MNIEEELIELKEMLRVVLEKIPSDDTSNEPYGSFLLRWYEIYKLPKNGVNTSHFMHYYITQRIVPILGDIPLNKLTGDDIQSFLNGLSGGNTRHKIAMIINGSLTKAVKLRLIKYNPYDVVELVSHRPKHYRALTVPEQKNVFSYLERTLYRSVGRILLCTGLRIGEFLALDNTCFDTDNQLIHVYKSVDIRSGKLQNRTKSYTSIRNVPYISMLAPDIDYLLLNIAKNGAYTYDSVKSCMYRCYKSLNIKGCNLHSFRHTFGCLCYRYGIDSKTIQHIMGHASLDVTMNIYVDVLGKGISIFDEYFKNYKKDVEMRPADFWKFNE